MPQAPLPRSLHLSASCTARSTTAWQQTRSLSGLISPEFMPTCVPGELMGTNSTAPCPKKVSAPLPVTAPQASSLPCSFPFWLRYGKMNKHTVRTYPRHCHRFQHKSSLHWGAQGNTSTAQPRGAPSGFHTTSPYNLSGKCSGAFPARCNRCSAASMRLILILILHRESPDCYRGRA